MKLPNISPGPWHHTGNKVKADYKGEPSYGILHLDADGPQPEWTPNLRAAAAVPQLLVALKWILNRAILEGCEWKEMEEANQALLSAGCTDY